MSCSSVQMRRTTNRAAVLSYAIFHAFIGEHSGFICLYPQCLPKSHLRNGYTFLCSFNQRVGLVKAGRLPCSWTVSDGTIQCRTTRSALEESNSSLSSQSYVEDSQDIPLLKERPSRANFATGNESPRNKRESSRKQARLSFLNISLPSLIGFLTCDVRYFWYQKSDVKKLKTDATTLMGSQDPGRAMGGERLIGSDHSERFSSDVCSPSETIDFLGVFSEGFKKINADAVEADGNVSAGS